MGQHTKYRNKINVFPSYRSRDGQKYILNGLHHNTCFIAFDLVPEGEK